MSAERSVRAVAYSLAPPSELWSRLADGSSWPDWGPWDATRVTRAGSGKPEGVGSVKLVVRGRYAIREQITAFERPHRFGYTVLSGIPAKTYDAEVRLTPDGDGGRIEWTARFVPRYPGTGWLLERGFRKVVTEVALALAATER